MMTEVLVRLTEPGQPLWLFYREMLPLEQSAKIDRHYAITVLTACFVVDDFHKEVALKEVTRSSIKTVCARLLKDRFLIGDEGQIQQMAETATRLVCDLIRQKHADAQQPSA